MSDYNIILASDINYLPYCFVTCQSIVNSLSTQGLPTSKDAAPFQEQACHHDQPDKLIFNIVVDETVCAETLSQIAQNFSARNKCSVDLEFKIKQVNSSLFEGAPKLNNAVSSYYRIVIDRLISKEVATALYLDSDLVVRHDIRELFKSTDLTGKVLAASVDLIIDQCDSQNQQRVMPAIDSKSSPLYISNTNHFNAGVLLINMEEWRKQGIQEKCFNILKTHAPVLQDQDLLNYIIEEPVLISPTWNFSSFYYTLHYDKATQNYTQIPPDFNNTSSSCSILNQMPDAKDFLAMASDPAIAHFNFMKPWASSTNLHYYLATLPTISGIYNIYKEWLDTASTVVEFKDELQQIIQGEIASNNLSSCIVNNKIVQTGVKMRRLESRYKRDKKIIVLAVSLIAALQLLTLIALLSD